MLESTRMPQADSVRTGGGDKLSRAGASADIHRRLPANQPPFVTVNISPLNPDRNSFSVLDFQSCSHRAIDSSDAARIPIAATMSSALYSYLLGILLR